jgi:hypothetical protein
MLRRWWDAYGATVLRVTLGLMVILAALRLHKGFGGLLWGRAGDLQLRHREVHLWFAGEPVYAVYPPASYAMLWPFLGWLPLSLARWLWAATAVAALVWLSCLIMRESGARTRLDRAWVALLPAAMYPTQMAVGLGQLIVHVLPLLLAGILQLRRPGGWRRDVWAAGLLLGALVKPSLSAPFFWIALFLPTGLRPVLVASGGYLGLTLVAASFQGDDLTSLFAAWLVRGSAVAVANSWSHTNVHTWLGVLGLARWVLVASGALLVALGVWTYQHRRVDVWLLLGVTALMARFWTYHILYDDLLILLPMIALFRLASPRPMAGGSALVAGVLLALTSLAMLAPGRILVAAPPSRWLAQAGYAVLWTAVLAFLIQQAHRGKRQAAAR